MSEREEEKLKEELRDTIALSNKIIDFHDEVMESKTNQVQFLETENKKLFNMVLEASKLLKVALKTSIGSIIN